MRHLTMTVLGGLILLGASFTCAGEDRWTLNQETPKGVLPRLREPLVLDGQIKEWSSATTLPLRYRSYIAARKSDHPWLGLADASAELYCAWNDEGLCLAARVADDDVRNDRPPNDYWKQDCIELFVDGRVGDRFRKPPYSLGAYQLLVRPPLADQPPDLVVFQREGTAPDLKIKGMLQPQGGGYVVEMLIPWSAFPALKPAPGAKVGLQFGLDDYDGRDGAVDQPMMMTWQAATGLYQSPQKFLEWTLVDAMPTGPDVPLGTAAALDCVDTLAEQEALEVNVELGSRLAPQTDDIDMRVTNWRGEVAAQAVVELRPMAAPWPEGKSGAFRWDVADVPDGAYLLQARLRGPGGKVLGTSTRRVLVVRELVGKGPQAIAEAIAALCRFDVRGLATNAPFRAKAVLGAAACIEKHKRGVETQSAPTILAARRELTARLAVLRGERVAADAGPLWDLLNLTADAETQVVVEYGRRELSARQQDAAVSFYWGAIPLVGVRVAVHETAAAARASLKPVEDVGLRDRSELVSVAGLPSRIRASHYGHAAVTLEDFRSDAHVLLVRTTENEGLVLDRQNIDWANPDGVVIAAGAPEKLREEVRLWAQKTNTPVLELPQARGKQSFLFTGDRQEVGELNLRRLFAVSLTEGPTALALVQGETTLVCVSPSRRAAELAVGAVVAREPVSAPQLDAIRRAVVASLPALGPPIELPGITKRSLYCGDVHMHSCYSDGFPTPVGLACESFYANMDFAVVTDHNTLDGALTATKLLGRAKFGHRVLVGEEITTNWEHLNAYPLQQLVSWRLTPEETVRAAHEQGAVIQWNHPGWSPDYPWTKRHLEIGLTGTGLDAWEHRPPHYEAWKAQNRLPVIVGSTDTHSGTFDRLERTIILAPSTEGRDLAEAIRSGNAVMVWTDGEHFVYGSDDMAARVALALREGTGLIRQAEHRIAESLREIDLQKLLKESPGKAVSPDEL
ncbi:hypothetical protein HQ590_01265 [bacterium]|nr:hypothetical protein [bacterium]